MIYFFNVSDQGFILCGGTDFNTGDVTGIGRIPYVNSLKKITFHQVADINVDNITIDREETIAIERENEEGETTIEQA